MELAKKRLASNGSRNLKRLSQAWTGAIEPLETRLFLSGTRANPILHPLITVSHLPKPAAAELLAAGAGSFGALSNVGAKKGLKADIIATDYTAFSLNANSIRQTLANAPMEFTKAARNPLVLAIPYPDGRFVRFNVLEAPVMEAGLAKKLPNVKTYRGQGVDDRSASIRLDITPLGFHAQILSPNGAFYIDPYWHLDQSTYVSYFKHDALPNPGNPFQCLDTDDMLAAAGAAPHDDIHDIVDGGDEVALTSSGLQLRTYRLACAASGEYTQFFGGTQALGQAAIVTAINRVTGVYETELTIRLQLVANNINLVYTNPAGDPYSNTANDINVNTSNCNAVIGVANYDIGHVFTTGSGGVAFLGCVGGGNKGGGTTGLPSPVGDAFYIDYVAHEMGHQFGANHTFNSSTGSCSGNRSASHAFEVGSGSTIMSYAGICGSDDLQAHSDPIFHFDSQQFIISFVDNSIPGVGTRTNTGNGIPTVNAGSSFTIPANTPFVMTATGSDPDSDPLTYLWEEHDLGASTTMAANDNGSSPIFRDFTPTSSPSRTFRKLSDIINNISTHNGEQLPSTNRASMNFRVTVRDNKSGGGAFQTSDTFVTIVNTGAAFLVTSPNTSVTWNGNTTQTVTWDVAGTTANGINTANVKILLSTDGGNTYPTVLQASTANDGSENITIPNITTTTARIRVEGFGNVFFDISNANFSINEVVAGNGLWTGLGDGVNWSDAGNWGNNHIPTGIDDVTIDDLNNPTIIVSGSQFANTISCNEALNIVGSLAISTASTFNSAATLATGGSITGNGALSFNTSLAMTGGSILGSNGAVTIGNSATMSITPAGVTRINRPLTINGTASLATGHNKLLRITGISVGANGKLDLNDNDLMVDYSGATVMPQISNLVRNARNGGAWNGASGITSTAAKNASPADKMLGLLEAFHYTANPTFDTEPLDADMILVKYTYYGDGDINGKVDGADYARTDFNFNLEVAQHIDIGGWINGDFDLNGKIDGADYALIDSAFNSQAGVL